MASLLFYRGLQVITPTPTGAGGLALENDLKYLRDGWFPLTEDTHWADQAASTSTITMNADLTTVIPVGTPVKFKLSGSYYYAIVTALAAGLLTLAGAPLTTGDGDLEELWIGDPGKVHHIHLHVAGAYADAANTTLLLTDAKNPHEWNGPAAALVQFRAYTNVETNNPKINVSVAGSAVGTANTNTGLNMAAAQTWYSTVVDLNTTNYTIARDEAFEVTTTEAADAADLTVELVIVEV